MNKLYLIGLVSAISLTACATNGASFAGANSVALKAEALGSVTLPDNWSQSFGEASAGFGDADINTLSWVKNIDDNRLETLVFQAFQNNPNLEVLAARLERAQALSRRAKSGLLPTLDGSAGASRTNYLEGTDNASAALNVGLDVGWDTDIWGRLKSSAQAEVLRSEAAQADYLAAQHLLAASVAENYFLSIEARQLAQVSERNLEALKETLGFVSVQFERGLRSGQDISLIRADVASAAVSYNRRLTASRDAVRALEVLLGQYPDAKTLLGSGLPVTPSLKLLGQPANILMNRPDMKAAIFHVEASYAAHRSALAARKPNLSLGGTLGGSSNVFGQVLDPTNLAATLLGSLTAPIFDGGARKANVAIAKADIDEAMANYREVAIRAFQDAEQQIDQGSLLETEETELETALSNAREALRFTQFRYESGENDLLNVLSVQQRVSFIEAQLVSTRRARLVQYVNLNLALGIIPTA